MLAEGGATLVSTWCGTTRSPSYTYYGYTYYGYTYYDIVRHHEVAERPRPAPERRAKRARRRRRRECPGCTEGGPRAGHHFRRGPGRVQAVCMRAVNGLCVYFPRAAHVL